MTDTGIVVARFDEVDIMPYLRMKDGNGNPVYEGDMINVYEYPYDNGNPYVVYTCNGGMYAKDVETGTIYLNGIDYFYEYALPHEVIGNIWESVYEGKVR